MLRAVVGTHSTINRQKHSKFASTHAGQKFELFRLRNCVIFDRFLRTAKFKRRKVTEPVYICHTLNVCNGASRIYKLKRSFLPSLFPSRSCALTETQAVPFSLYETGGSCVDVSQTSKLQVATHRRCYHLAVKCKDWYTKQIT